MNYQDENKTSITSTTKSNLTDSWDFNDTGNADRLVALYGQDLCYCAERKKLAVWDGRRWAFDGLKVEKLAESTMTYAKEASRKMEEPQRGEFRKHISRSLSQQGLQNMIRAGQKKVRSVSISEFDCEPDVLNCANGIVMLSTGDLIPHFREAMCTKMIPLNYDPDAPTPVFNTFMEQIMEGGKGTTKGQRERARTRIEFLQRLAGVAATGVCEKVLPICYGSGDNGKTTYFNCLMKALGDLEYAGQIQIESLMEGRDAGMSNAVASDLADLKGRRLVVTSETGRAMRLAVARVKHLTGGERIKARYLHENWMTFWPTHLLMMDTNHRPVIDDSTDAVWNRVIFIPFNYQVPREGRDTSLPQKLEAELPGISDSVTEAGSCAGAKVGEEFFQI